MKMAGLVRLHFWRISLQFWPRLPQCRARMNHYTVALSCSFLWTFLRTRVLRVARAVIKHDSRPASARRPVEGGTWAELHPRMSASASK